MSHTTITDQLGREVEVRERPRRIVSLCPSTTETVFALGGGDRLVGRTDYCVHPRPDVDAIDSVGGTKKVAIDRVAARDPDLVLAVKEENQRDEIETIAARWPTVVLDPVDVESAADGITITGRAMGRAAAGTRLADDVRTAFRELPSAGGRRIAYLIWRKPFMAAGRGTYLDDVLTRLGFENVAAEVEGRYPELSRDRVESLAPELLLASSEPFPFDRSHLPELQEFAPRATPVLVDGEMFSWHGVRMIVAASYFRELISTLPPRRTGHTGSAH